MVKAKKTRTNKYIYWYKEKHLFYLPVPYWSYCDECSHRDLRWNKKGFVLLKRTRCRRLKTAMDVLMEKTANYYRSLLLNIPFNLSYTGKFKKGGTIKFKRYGSPTSLISESRV